jgi:putative transposase
MSSKKHIISLTQDLRSKLEIIERSRHHSKRERDRAKVLLLTDTNQEGILTNDAQIAASVGIQTLTVSKIRARAVARGVLESLGHKEQANRKARSLDGAAEAQLVTIACSQAPDGRKRWTMQLLKERLIQMEIVESIDEATVCRTLKKIHSSHG